MHFCFIFSFTIFGFSFAIFKMALLRSLKTLLAFTAVLSLSQPG